jgi:hypothetical protein
MRITMCCLLLVVVASPVWAQGGMCQRDVMGQTFCPRTSGGTAVLDGRGDVVCAPGQCVKGRNSSEWHCSAASGGWARVGSDGPECEGGCTPLSNNQCRQL